MVLPKVPSALMPQVTNQADRILAGQASQDIAPGQALLRQLQMSRSLSSPQGLHNGHAGPESQTAALASGWDVYPAQSSSPFFDPAIVNASSSAFRESGAHILITSHCLPPRSTTLQAFSNICLSSAALASTHMHLFDSRALG